MLNNKIAVHESKQKGRGLFAKQKILKDEIIWTRDNNEEIVINYKQYLLLPKILQSYFYEYGWVWRDDIILPLGTDSLMNHSCEPNVFPTTRDMWKAIKDIEVGDEVTYDYELTTTSKLIPNKKPMRCSCGSKYCRKLIK
jgi:SET domain-containing protein